ncbi:uncharacterized protein LOC136065460 [Quercus suber]|uniref:uncharacterized protein LOC136065460 n=1 Tax=Quercus suber TaxID=58331 RepID=UPI0032DF9464
MERETLKRSDEEEDTLARSTKKFKDGHRVHETKESGMGVKMGSYKDKLVGAIPGAFAQAFGFDVSMQEDVESDCEEENEQDGSSSIRIGFTKEEKIHMRSPWQKALIIKTFGRRMAFSFLVERVRKMWNPCGGMDCIDLGYDYFLVKFELAEDMDSILMGGPWFIGQHFLAIRQWEPGFKASTATLSSVAVWIRLPELPLEFYEPSAILKIGRAIGPVLRIDSHTANGERGRFARLCVQVNLDKPLVRKLFLGKIEQCVLYEGINSLCFSCGRIGHKVDSCPYTNREQPKEQRTNGSDEQSEMQNTKRAEEKNDKEKAQHEYGEWMVVNKRKNSSRTRPMQSAQGRSYSAEAQLTQTSLAANTEPSAEGQSRREGKRKVLHTQPIVSQKENSVIATSNLNQSKGGKGVKNKGIRAKTHQKAMGLVGVQPFGVGPSNKSGCFVFGSEVVRGPLGLSGTSSPIGNTKEALITPGKESNASVHSISCDGRQGETGEFIQGNNDSGEQQARFNRGVGLVRNRADGGVEGRGVDNKAEPMVEILEGSSSSSGASEDKLRNISNRIRHAELGKISVRSGREDDRDRDLIEEVSEQHSGGMFLEGQCPRVENDPSPGDLGVEERDDGCMEVERQ